MSDYQVEVKKLTNEVQLLRDELAIMKRKYEDIIYNLDTENFSSRFAKEQGNMKASIEFTAEKIKTAVTDEEFQSAMEQTANQISIEVSSLDNKLSSQISTTANGISTRVERVENGQFNGYTLFEQSWDKFSFTGNVEISGDAIVGGILTGSAIQNTNGTTKLELGHYTGSTVGDMLLKRIDSSGKEQTIFSVIDNFQSIYLTGMGKSFMQLSSTTAYPIGTWDFSRVTDVTGLNVSAVAVFG